MKISLGELEIDKYFLLGNLLFKIAKLHKPETTPDFVPYTIKITERSGGYEIYRQLVRVAVVVVDQKNIAEFVFDKCDWGKEFEKWVLEEVVKNPAGDWDAFFVKR